MRLFVQYALLVVCLFFGFLAVPLLALAGAPAGRLDGPVLVVAAPWSDLDGIIALSGGQVVGADRALFGQLGTSSDPGFSKRLKANGAWLVLDGSKTPLFCGATI